MPYRTILGVRLTPTQEAALIGMVATKKVPNWRDYRALHSRALVFLGLNGRVYLTDLGRSVSDVLLEEKQAA